MQLASYLDGMQLMWMTNVNPKPDDLYDNDQNHVLSFLSHNIMSVTEITPCNKIYKPLVVYRLSGNVMMSITTLGT